MISKLVTLVESSVRSPVIVTSPGEAPGLKMPLLVSTRVVPPRLIVPTPRMMPPALLVNEVLAVAMVPPVSISMTPLLPAVMLRTDSVPPPVARNTPPALLAKVVGAIVIDCPATLPSMTPLLMIVAVL